MHHQRPSKPCRCLFHITPAIPNRHLIPSSLLFFIHNSQLALNGGCFQAELPPNSYRRPRLGSNNGSGDIRDGMVSASRIVDFPAPLVPIISVVESLLSSTSVKWFPVLNRLRHLIFSKRIIDILNHTTKNFIYYIIILPNVLFHSFEL